MRPERHEEAADAAALCAQLRHVYWIGGGSGAGKSVIARRMAARHGLYLYATDDVMPDHGSRCAPGDCPFLMPAMVGVLARAFYDDPPMVWMIPDHQSRDRRLRRMFITILRHEAMRHGGVDVAWSGDRIVGAAVWMPPDTWKPPSAAQQLRSVPGFMRAFGRRISAASALMTPSLRRFRGSGL